MEGQVDILGYPIREASSGREDRLLVGVGVGEPSLDGRQFGRQVPLDRQVRMRDDVLNVLDTASQRGFVRQRDLDLRVEVGERVHRVERSGDGDKEPAVGLQDSGVAGGPEFAMGGDRGGVVVDIAEGHLGSRADGGASVDDVEGRVGQEVRRMHQNPVGTVARFAVGYATHAWLQVLSDQSECGGGGRDVDAAGEIKAGHE